MIKYFLNTLLLLSFLSCSLMAQITVRPAEKAADKVFKKLEKRTSE
jgi:hypothetical protein